MALKFKCPNCNEKIVTKFLKAGDTVECKKCGAELTVPEHATQTSEESTFLNSASEIADSAATTASQPTQSKPYPGILQAIWVIILINLLIISLALLSGAIGAIINYPLHKHPALIAIVNLVAIVLVLVIDFGNTKARFQEVFPLTPIKTSLLFPLTITLIGLMIVLAEMTTLISVIIPGRSEQFAKYFISLFDKSLWGTALALVVVAPFTEEFLFRGLILRGFLNRYSIIKAILVSALLFALFHSIFQFLSAFLAGILLAWWFVKTRSLLPCIYGHIVNNALILIFIIIIPPKISDLTEPAQFGPLWLDVVGFVLLGLGIWLSVRMFKKIEIALP
ncbi:CPBP family intramembrane metalloprotease [candidate division WOR-3 bacterium]|nr:CPBP family intramembrane metalloprotease [candidate division WOR-3 bacterium]